jgi:SAM-dependent methyltransferase
MFYKIISLTFLCTLNLALYADSNQQTIDSYNAHIDYYVQKTPHTISDEFKIWIDKALSYLTKEDHILELGSAFGRDATYIESCGYTIQRSDTTQGFIDILKNQGHHVVSLNVLNDELPNAYSTVFANAVFLHFTPEEFALALGKIHKALPKQGHLVFSVKRGSGTEWSTEKLDAPRFFCYWQAEPLTVLLNSNGFVVDSIDSTEKWLYVIAHTLS